MNLLIRLFSVQIGWLVGDNISVNDVAVRTACHLLNLDRESVPESELDPKELRGRQVFRGAL